MFAENFPIKYRPTLRTIYFHTVHAVIADEFLMVYNTEIKLQTFANVGIKFSI